MKARRWTIAFVLLALISLAVVGLRLTRESNGAGVPAGADPGGRAPLVDEQPSHTARTVAALASGRGEQRLAQQALKLADHEVDLAFAGGLRDAAEHPVPPTAQAKDLLAQASKAQATVKEDQERVDQLKKQAAEAAALHPEVLDQQLALAQAQLELDQDELENAKGDLIRLGADPLSRIQRQFNRHEAATHENDADRPQNAPSNTDATSVSGNLVAQLSVWHALRAKELQLEQARDEALRNADTLKLARDKLAQQVSTEQTHKQAISQQVTTQLKAGSSGDPGQTRAAATATITSLRHLANDQKDLSDLDKRIQDHDELGSVYGRWVAIVESDQRAAIHGMLGSALWILSVLLTVYLGGRLADHFFAGLKRERTRLRTLRMVARFVIQAVGLLFIILVVVGAPSQTTTILGLAGAGLTVALKNFIVAFFGWFVLMGRNGIRVGDWVEINGVVGEVVEINLLRTVLLETGNWTDTGHPTGRKVAFVNSFAVEGHFFNLSTTGQWLWDEITMMVPSSQNPYPVMDAMKAMVEKETQANAQMAEQEWQRAPGDHRAQSVSAAPAINLRPTASGVEVRIRYIARAGERYAVRTHLYQELVRLLHPTQADPSATQGGSETKTLGGP